MSSGLIYNKNYLPSNHPTLKNYFNPKSTVINHSFGYVKSKYAYIDLNINKNNIPSVYNGLTLQKDVPKCIFKINP